MVMAHTAPNRRRGRLHMEQTVGGISSAIVRIWDARGIVVGAGLLVSPRELLTCAHVAGQATRQRNGEAGLLSPPAVRVDFPLVAPGETLEAELVVWHPPQQDETGDVAGLRLTSAPPAGAHQARRGDARDT